MTTFDDAEVVNRRAAKLSVLLGDTDAPARAMKFPEARIQAAARHRIVVRWRIAAGIALLIAGAAGVPPVRAWIVGTVHSAWLKVTGTAPALVAVKPAAAVSSASMGTVTFPAMDPVTIRVVSRQDAGGSLVIATGSPQNVSASITGVPDGAELAVLPDGLRIGNRRSATAGYLVRVPAGVSRVSVLIADERPMVFSLPSAGDRYTVDLGVRSGMPGTLKK